jgi:hypothetical protein
MKKLWLTLALGLLVGVNQLQAQLRDKLIPHMGFMYEVVDLRKPVNIGDGTLSRVYYAFNIGTYYTLLHQNDVLSLGVDGSVNFGFNFFSTGQRSGVNLLVQTPVFLMGRLGANSTRYNQQKFGMGAGLGLVYTFFHEGVFDQKSQGVNPSVVVEGTILSRGGGGLTLRGHFSIYRPSATLKQGNATFEFREFSNWGVGLIYGF